MGLFDINFSNLVWDNTPSEVRKPRMIAWLRVLCTPFVWLYDLFRSNRAKNLYEITHNSQVCRMQAVLNDQFDTILRRIRIVDAERIEPVWIYRRAEQRPVFLFTRLENDSVYGYRRQEMTRGGAFVVELPVALNGLIDLAQLRALIDKYRLAGKSNYKIKFV